MSEELIYKTDENLNQILRCLNGVFLTIAQAEEKKEMLAEIFKCVSVAFEEKDSKKLFNSLKKISTLEKHATSHHEKLFKCIEARELTSIAPLIGKKATKSSYLFCKDFVIGLVLTSGEDVLRYRLDFDEKKSLHVNLDFIFKNNKKMCEYNFAITNIKLPTKYYVIEHNKVQTEAVKFKFFAKMSTAYYNAHVLPKEDNTVTKILNKTGCDDLSEVINNKENRNIFLREVLEECTGGRENKEARIAHQAKLPEVDSEEQVSDTSNKM